MSTAAWRSAVIVCAEMMMSQLPPVRAGMIESNVVDLTATVRLSRLASSAARSMSEPIAVLLESRLS